MPNSAAVDCGADCAAVEAGKPKEALKCAGEGAEEAVGGNPKPAAQAVPLSDIAMVPAFRRQSAQHCLHHQRQCPDELFAHMRHLLVSPHDTCRHVD